MLDTESAQRGFLLTGNDGYLLHYQTSVERLPILLGNLRRLMTDNTPRNDTWTGCSSWWKRACSRSSMCSICLREVAWSRHASIRQNALLTTSAIREQSPTMVQRESGTAGAAHRKQPSKYGLARWPAFRSGWKVVGTVYGLLMRELRHRAQAERLAAQANRELDERVGALQRSTADLNLLSR